MIKIKNLEFHETFQPEMVYIAKILKLASENFTGTKFEISDCSDIPTGKQKGKVEPHIKYAKFMGLIEYSYDNGLYNLSLSNLGKEVYLQDMYLHENLTYWLCHYGMVNSYDGAPQWAYLIHDAHPGLCEGLSTTRFYNDASIWCNIPIDNIQKKVFSVVKNSYTDGCFEQINFLTWDEKIHFNEISERFDLLYVYAYAILDSWEKLFPDKQEITLFELKNDVGFDKIFGFNEDECNYVLDALNDEGLFNINRQLFPITLIKTSNVDSIIEKLYSRLL